MKARRKAVISVTCVLMAVSVVGVGYSAFVLASVNPQSQVDVYAAEVTSDGTIEDLGLAINSSDSVGITYITNTSGDTTSYQVVDANIKVGMTVDLEPTETPPLTIYNLDYDTEDYAYIKATLTMTAVVDLPSSMSVYPSNYPAHNFEGTMSKTTTTQRVSFYFPIKSQTDPSLYSLAMYDKSYPVYTSSVASYKVPLVFQFNFSSVNISNLLLYNAKYTITFGLATATDMEADIQ